MMWDVMELKIPYIPAVIMEWEITTVDTLKMLVLFVTVSQCMCMPRDLYIMIMLSMYIRESVDSLCRDGADTTRHMEWLRTPKCGTYKPF